MALGYESEDYNEGPCWASMAYVLQPSAEKVDPFDPPPATHRHLWNGARCFSCGKWSVWFDGEMVYPRRSTGTPAHPDMPEPIRELYEEAAAVAAVSRRAGAALARATMERLIKHLDPGAPERAKLEQRIERLRPRVSADLWRMLTVVRVAGNQAVHVEDAPGELVILALDDEEGPAILELLLETVNDLVDELITRPKVKKDLFDTLPEQIRAKSEAVDD